MFYFTPDGWKIFPKKITYTQEVETYDMSDEPYQEFSNVQSEDVILTEEQLRRFETIKNVQSIGIEDIKKFVFEQKVEDEGLVDLQSEVKAEETRQKLARLIRWDEITSEDMMDLIDDFKEYSIGSFYVAGDIFSLNNQLYQVLQAHTSQEDWPPDQTPALYKAIAPPSVIPEWNQPTGAHDAYNKGDKVLFSGKVYESLIDGNTWSPSAYPQGWKEIVV
ncbi:carbohydrate-binding protein [Proteiniclasticum ruminis]|uniref:carbohydrate-binding protein n=1 Tax=Proteiniclasticum ruminis TaxID=398199 RepID=UPI0028A7BA86|nr:carbohydrate-binding protein [Proteiniclasticum ruminis]